MWVVFSCHLKIYLTYFNIQMYWSPRSTGIPVSGTLMSPFLEWFCQEWCFVDIGGEGIKNISINWNLDSFPLQYCDMWLVLSHLLYVLKAVSGFGCCFASTRRWLGTCRGIWAKADCWSLILQLISLIIFACPDGSSENAALSQFKSHWWQEDFLSWLHVEYHVC